MKKIITVIMFVLIESCMLIVIVMLYQSNKQIRIANEIFDNTIETLRSRNFSKNAIATISAGKEYRFTIIKLEPYKFRIAMEYPIDYQSDKKTLYSIVYQQR